MSLELQNRMAALERKVDEKLAELRTERAALKKAIRDTFNFVQRVETKIDRAVGEGVMEEPEPLDMAFPQCLIDLGYEPPPKQPKPPKEAPTP